MRFMASRASEFGAVWLTGAMTLAGASVVPDVAMPIPVAAAARATNPITKPLTPRTLVPLGAKVARCAWVWMVVMAPPLLRGPCPPHRISWAKSRVLGGRGRSRRRHYICKARDTLRDSGTAEARASPGLGFGGARYLL